MPTGFYADKTNLSQDFLSMTEVMPTILRWMSDCDMVENDHHNANTFIAN